MGKTEWRKWVLSCTQTYIQTFVNDTRYDDSPQYHLSFILIPHKIPARLNKESVQVTQKCNTNTYDTFWSDIIANQHAVSCTSCNNSSMQKQVTSCIQLYRQVSLHVSCDLNTTLHATFAQDNQGYYVQDLISNNFYDGETVTAFCERYMYYHSVTVKNKINNHYRCNEAL